MCIIVDANKMGAFLADPPGKDAAPVRRWIDTGSGSVVYSTAGKFADEIRGHARQRLLRYSQAGKAKFVPEDRFVDDQNTLEGQIRSDPMTPMSSRWRGRPEYVFCIPETPI